METKKLKDLSFEALCGIIAKVIHSANVAYVDAIGGRAVNPSWEEAREEQRSGLIKAVASTIVNPQTPSVSHEQWCLAREKEGWTKDVKYDYNRKTHPNMVPFDQLPAEEQFKDHLYMGIASIFCGGWEILDMPEVQAARRILQVRFDNESELHKLDVEDDDPVDHEETEALQAKLQEAKDKLAAAEAEQVINGVEKIYEPVMDNENGEQDGELAAAKIAAAADEIEITDGPATVNGVQVSGHDPDNPEPESPLPSADEILDNKPADYTAKDLAEDVLGADKVGIVDGVGSGEIKETPDGPKPNLPAEEVAKPTTAKKPAKKSSAK